MANLHDLTGAVVLVCISYLPSAQKDFVMLFPRAGNLKTSESQGCSQKSKKSHEF